MNNATKRDRDRDRGIHISSIYSSPRPATSSSPYSSSSHHLQGGASSDPITAAVVKPVTPRTWQATQQQQNQQQNHQIDIRKQGPVSVYENDVYGRQQLQQQGGEEEQQNNSTEQGVQDDSCGSRDHITSYQPLSARLKSRSGVSGTLSTASVNVGSTTNGVAAAAAVRPPSRLGTQRGIVKSTFIIPPLNLSTAKTTAKASQEAVSTTTATTTKPPAPRTTSFKLPSSLSSSSSAPSSLSGHPQPSMAVVTTNDTPTSPTSPSSPSRTATRLGRPLASLASPTSKLNPTTAAIGPAPGFIPRQRSHTPDFSGTYRSSDHNELLIKASGWIERPSVSITSSNTESNASFATATSSAGQQKAEQQQDGIKRNSTESVSGTPHRPSAEAVAAWVAASRSFVLPNNIRDPFSFASTHPGSRPSSAALAAKAAATIMPGLSNYTAARRFLLAPGPINEPLKCRVERRKSGLFGGFVHYIMILEEGECVMLTARRYHKANGAAAFEIFIPPPLGVPHDTPALCVSKLGASFLGTEYVLTGCGQEDDQQQQQQQGRQSPPQDGSTSGVKYGFRTSFRSGSTTDEDEVSPSSPAARSSKSGQGERGERILSRSSSGASRSSGTGVLTKGGEMGSVMYSPNIMGTKGPRKVTVVLPKLVSSGNSAWELQPACIDAPLISKYRQGFTSDCIVLRNRPPKWNAALGAYCLHFGGRVTHASVKNIQLVSEEDENLVVLQFGKVGSDAFSLDYQFPMTPLQAFAVALASLDPKLGCE